MKRVKKLPSQLTEFRQPKAAAGGGGSSGGDGDGSCLKARRAKLRRALVKAVTKEEISPLMDNSADSST